MAAKVLSAYDPQLRHCQGDVNPTVYVGAPSVFGNVKRTWREVVEKDCQARKLNKEDSMDRSRWMKLIKYIR